jgi:hypothetical protein
MLFDRFEIPYDSWVFLNFVPENPQLNYNKMMIFIISFLYLQKLS